MKKIMLLLVLLVSANTFSQETITEGVVTSKMTMSSPNEQVKARLEMMGEIESTVYFKDNKSRAETSNPMSGNSIVIIDNDVKEMLMLMDNPMSGKIYMKQSFEPSEEDLKNLKIEKGTETKTILGYECLEYIITMNKDGVEAMRTKMFATDKLAAISQQTTAFGDKIEGFPLYMEMSMNENGMDMTITYEVTEIKKETVSDDKLSMTPPEGYTEFKNPNGQN